MKKDKDTFEELRLAKHKIESKYKLELLNKVKKVFDNVSIENGLTKEEVALKVLAISGVFSYICKKPP